MSEQHQASASTQDVEQPTLMQFTAKYGEALNISVNYDPKHKIWTQDKKEQTEEEKQKAEKGNDNFLAKILQMVVAMNTPQAPQEEHVFQNENGEKFTLESFLEQYREMAQEYYSLQSLLAHNNIDVATLTPIPTQEDQEND